MTPRSCSGPRLLRILLRPFALTEELLDYAALEHLRVLVHNCPWCLQLSLEDVCGSLVLLASAWVVHEDRMMRFTLSAASAVVVADQFPRFLEDGMSLHFQDEYLRHLLEDLTLSAARLVCVTVRPLDGGWALALARHLSGFQLETLLSPGVFLPSLEELAELAGSGPLALVASCLAGFRAAADAGGLLGRLLHSLGVVFSEDSSSCGSLGYWLSLGKVVRRLADQSTELPALIRGYSATHPSLEGLSDQLASPHFASAVAGAVELLGSVFVLCERFQRAASLHDLLGVILDFARLWLSSMLQGARLLCCRPLVRPWSEAPPAWLPGLKTPTTPPLPVLARILTSSSGWYERVAASASLTSLPDTAELLGTGLR